MKKLYNKKCSFQKFCGENQMTFKQLAIKILEKSNMPLTAKEIWEYEPSESEKIGSIGATPWQTLGSHIYVEINNNPSTEFAKVGRGYFGLKRKDYSNWIPAMTSDADSVTASKIAGGKIVQVKMKECNMHSRLARFLLGEPHFNCRTKTIDAGSSKKGNKGDNEWKHPDMIGVYFPHEDYSELSTKISKTLQINLIKLFSFELKRSVGRGDLRKSYFQAVANSSWANEGYLVVSEIDTTNVSLMNELTLLHNQFGIGVIQLNCENPADSKIIIYAKVKDSIDLQFIDSLIELGNKDISELFVEICRYKVTMDAGHASVTAKIFDKVE